MRRARALVRPRLAVAAACLASAATISAVPHHSAASSAGVAASAIDGTVRIEVSLGARQLRVIHGDEVETYPVAIGRGSKQTPTGSFRIRKIVWNPAWIPPDEEWARKKKPEAPGSRLNPMKLVKIFFREPDYYIHGTSDIESLGDAASHGCLRMDPDDAYRVARTIMEHGGEPRSENWFWRTLHFRSETKTVYLDRPVAMTVN